MVSRRSGFALLVVLLAILMVVVLLTIRATTRSPAQVRSEKAWRQVRQTGEEMVKYADDNLAEFPKLLDEAKGESDTLFAEPVGYGGAMVDAHEKSKRLKCRNNLKQIGMALFMHRQMEDGKWPGDLETLVEKKYLTNRKVLQCPSARTPAGSVDYVLVRTKTTGGRPRRFAPADVIVYDRTGNHKGGRNVLQFDQQTLWLSEEQFKKRMGNEPFE